ncbi:hypothetical protein E4T56_gene14203 [Termitomyces sp. T112]|nr:hypothetical protein E4T56_gene14203 [Termitomyces sp. T112]
METGTDMLKTIDCRRNNKKEAVATALPEIDHRQWLVMEAQSTDEFEPVPFTSSYKRVGIDLPDNEWEGAPTSNGFSVFKRDVSSKGSLNHYEHFQLIVQVEAPGIIFNCNFKDADKTWVIVKIASCRQDILRLKREAYGLFLYPGPYFDTSFGALLLEDKGFSLAQYYSESPIRFTLSLDQSIKFRSLLNKLHDEGIVHGSLTRKSLVINRNQVYPMDVSTKKQ